MVGKKEALIRIRNILQSIRGISNISTYDKHEIEDLESEIAGLENELALMIDNYMANKFQQQYYAKHRGLREVKLTRSA
jgi:hypothetical protein